MEISAVYQYPNGETGEMLYSKVFPLDTFPAYKYVVIFSKMNGKWLFSQHRDRDTWETQGGHIEKGETPLDAARRELYEESGATEFEIEPVCDYWSGQRTGCGVGVVFFADVKKRETLPKSEMKCVQEFDALPPNVTYPAITPHLYEFMMQWLKNKGETP